MKQVKKKKKQRGNAIGSIAANEKNKRKGQSDALMRCFIQNMSERKKKKRCGETKGRAGSLTAHSGSRTVLRRLLPKRCYERSGSGFPCGACIRELGLPALSDRFAGGFEGCTLE